MRIKFTHSILFVDLILNCSCYFCDLSQNKYNANNWMKQTDLCSVCMCRCAYEVDCASFAVLKTGRLYSRLQEFFSSDYLHFVLCIEKEGRNRWKFRPCEEPVLLSLYTTLSCHLWQRWLDRFCAIPLTEHSKTRNSVIFIHHKNHCHLKRQTVHVSGATYITICFRKITDLVLLPP